MSQTPAGTAVSRFQNRLPSSLYEVAWQYSLLDWYDAARSEAIDWELSPEHLAYLTPRAQSDLFGQDDSLVIVYADLSDPDNPALRSDSEGGPVEITTYTTQDRFRVGHSYPEGKTSSMTDYSITTQKTADAHHIAGLRDDAWGTNNIQDRFTDWPQSESADRVRESASEEDTAILDALAALGDDDDAMDRLADAFLNQVESEDTEIDALITVKVRLPGEDEYKFPGEVGVLNDVMREKKAARLESISVEDASGTGTGYVTGDEETVTGGSPGLFGMYGKKQREHFHDLDTAGGSAWQNRPLSFDVAAAVAAAGSLFEDFYRGLGNNRRLYVLPYLATRKQDLSAETFDWFATEVYETLQGADTGADGEFDTVVENIIRQVRTATPDTADGIDLGDFGVNDGADWGSVRLAVVHQVTGNPDRVYFDTLDGISPVLDLYDAHVGITGSSLFRESNIFHGNEGLDSSFLLSRSPDLHRYILYGGYFQRTTEPTRSSRQASETPGAGAVDDSRMGRVRDLLTDTDVNASRLLDEYVHQLVQDQREAFGSDESYLAFPTRSLVEQYVQARALTDIGALDTSSTFEFTTTAMPDDFENRTDRLDAFIDNHDALSEDRHKAVFLLGGLVGRISAFQQKKDVSSTLIRRYPVDYLTKQTVTEVTKEVLQMNNSYAEAYDKLSYVTNSRYTERLPEVMLSATPTEWSVTEPELQWLYSLGIAYGLNDKSLYSEDEDEDAEAGEDAAADEINA
ncbi:TM1802 family CRISPR-associated protein [Salarchaeum sp. III]|uniref:TM1802 family CRISPR-associated protein n=1 Tax=Salarchaeum sp. III TaxID=3107927 RepID=UPI002EDBA652